MLATLVLLLGSLAANNEYSKGNDPATEKLNPVVNCTPELTDLGTAWVSAFNKVNPANTIELNNPAKPDGSGLLLTTDKNALSENKALELIVGKKIIVPFINVKNPLLPEIQKKGVSTNAFFRMFEQAAPVWGSLLQNNQSGRVTLFVADDETIKSSVARFLQIKSLNVDGIQIQTAQTELENWSQQLEYKVQKSQKNWVLPRTSLCMSNVWHRLGNFPPL